MRSDPCFSAMTRKRSSILNYGFGSRRQTRRRLDRHWPAAPADTTCGRGSNLTKACLRSSTFSTTPLPSSKTVMVTWSPSAAISPTPCLVLIFPAIDKQSCPPVSTKSGLGLGDQTVFGDLVRQIFTFDLYGEELDCQTVSVWAGVDLH